MTRLRRLAPRILLAAAAVVPAFSAAAQQGADAVFVARLGKDTLAVETLAWRGATADARLRLRTPAVTIRQVVRLGAASVVEQVRTTVAQGAAADSGARVAELAFAGDSMRVHVVTPAGSPDTTIAVPRGAVPFMNLSGLSLELILRRARAVGGDTARVPLLVTGAQRPFVATVVRAAGDSATIAIGGVVLRVRTDTLGQLLGAAVPSQMVVIERVIATAPGGIAAAAWTGTAAPPSYAAPAGAPYTARDVVIEARAGRLAGTLTVPAHPRGARVPAVVLISGSGPQDRDETAPSLPQWHPFREIADTLSRRGIAVLRLDDRGVGGSALPKAGATLLDEAEDVRDAVAWVRRQEEVDPARVGLLGHSSGGAVAPLVAATDPAVKAVVLVAGPASSGRVLSAYQVRYLFAEDTTLPPARRDSLLRVALRQADSAWATPGWLAHFGTYDPLATARRLRAAVLVLHGETDRQVPVQDAARLVQAMREAGNRKVALRTFPRLNHLMVDDPSGHPLRYDALPSLHVRADLKGVLAEWLARAL